MKTVRKIDSTNSLISTELFPLVSGVQKKSNHHFALIGIGGNIGDSTRRFAHLIHYLRRVPFVSIVETSPIVKNPPFGYLEQPYFCLLYTSEAETV